MKYRKLGNTDIDVSEICLGSMTWGVQNTQQDAFDQLNYSLEQGINFIDTAEIYPVPVNAKKWGTTDRYIGEWFKQTGNRDKVILAGKVAGRSPMGFLRKGAEGLKNTKESRLSREQILYSCDEALKRLQTDYIDIFQLHWPERSTNFFGKLNYVHADDNDPVPLEETLAAMGELVKSGKVRHIGLSNETAWGTMKYMDIAKEKGLPKPVSIQNPYSLLCLHYEVGLAEISMREKCGLLAYSPLGFGALSGKYLGGEKPEGARITLWPQEFPRYFTDKGVAATTEYVKLAQDNGLDPSQMALAYLLTKPFVTSLIIGATTRPQLEINIGASDLELSDELMKKLEALTAKYSNPCP
ncbi:MAG: aldo/keto reductase [Candidatus Portiera sp.]|nr:aldo/keto reductase [Portiera sp.]